MKHFALFLLLVATLATAPAQANGPWLRMFQDIKTPSQEQIEHFKITNPALGSGIAIKTAASVGPTATTISTFSNQPDFPRNIVITPGGSTGNVLSGTAVVTGTNIFGKTISENFSITSSQSGATTGSKAFKTLTSIVFPATSNPSGVTITVIAGAKMGIPRCMTNAGDLIFGESDGVYETTRGTMAVNATAVESNTYTPQTAMNGSKNIDIFYVQNFRCFPN